jgi:hypothetical protein
MGIEYIDFTNEAAEKHGLRQRIAGIVSALAVAALTQRPKRDAAAWGESTYTTPPASEDDYQRQESGPNS